MNNGAWGTPRPARVRHAPGPRPAQQPGPWLARAGRGTMIVAVAPIRTFVRRHGRHQAQPGWTPKRSHSFMRGSLEGGPPGLLRYAERVLRAGRGRARQSWTVACHDLAEVGGPAAGIACVPRQNPLWGGRLKLVSILPRELTPVAVGDAKFDQSYEVGIVGNGDRTSIPAVFTADFTAWMCELPFRKTRRRLHALRGTRGHPVRLHQRCSADHPDPGRVLPACSPDRGPGSADLMN
jgi:hypothetical protein